MIKVVNLELIADSDYKFAECALSALYLSRIFASIK